LCGMRRRNNRIVEGILRPLRCGADADQRQARRSAISSLLPHHRSSGREGARNSLSLPRHCLRGDLRARLLRDHVAIVKAATKDSDTANEMEAADVARYMAPQEG